MRIKALEQEFLQEKVDRIDNISSLEYTTFFKAYVGIEDSEVLDLALFNISNMLKNRKDAMIIEDNLYISTDLSEIEKAKQEYLLVERASFKNSGLKLIEDISLNSILLSKLDDLFILLKNEIEHNKSNFATKFILWIKKYLKNIQTNNSQIPKCLYYGNIKKHETYFLMFLNMCGFDVLYINPNSSSNIKIASKYSNNLEINEAEFISEIYSLKIRIANGEMLEKTSIDKVKTITAQAQEKIQEEILKDTGVVIDNWQLQDKKIKPIILDTTFEEIKIYYNQPFSFRPHYKLNTDTIEAPVFLSKIIGIHENNRDYYDFVNSMKKDENTLFLEFSGDEGILRTKEFTRNDFRLSYLIDSNGNINRKDTVNKNEFELSILDTKLQNKILDALEDVFKLRFFIEELTNNDKVQILHFALNLNRKLLLLLENFAYGRINPKLVLYINDRISLSKEFVSIILLMNKLGVDAFLLTPVGSKDIEKIIDENIINIHRLSKVVESFSLNELEQLKSNSKSFISKLFDKLKI